MSIYVSRFASWAPGLNSPADWEEWAQGQKEIESSAEAPSLGFAESPWLKLSPKEFSLFKRRQSQISRMAIHVLHEIMPIGENTKTIFVSFRGEIAMQFKINPMLIEEGDISPSAFSQSVFNTPPALAAIALGLRQGYSAVYPGYNRFETGFQAAIAPLLSTNAQATEVALIYADELCPPEYPGLSPQQNKPLAFAVLLSTTFGCRFGKVLVSGTSSPRLQSTKEPGILISPNGEYLNSPESFLRFLYQNKRTS